MHPALTFLLALWHIPGRIWSGMLRAGSLALWAQIGAGVAFTLFAAGVVLILWRGPWTLAVERARVDGLVLVALGGLLVVLVALVAIAGLRLGLKAGRGGLEAAVERDDETPQTIIETTMKTEIAK